MGRDGLLGGSQELGEETSPLRGHARQGFRIEDVAVVFDAAAQLAGFSPHANRKIEFDVGVECRHHFHAYAGQFPHLFQPVLKSEHDLKQRLPAVVSLCLQPFHQLVKGDILVFIRFQRSALHLCQQFMEIGLVVEISRQHQHIDKQPDQPLYFWLVAPGHRRANANLVLMRVQIEQRMPGGKQGHKQGTAGDLPHLAQLLAERSVKRKVVDAALKCRQGGARAVSGQIKRWRIQTQLFGPVGKLALDIAALGNPLLLPAGKVGVLDGKRRQVGRFLPAKSRIQRRHILRKNLDRPAIHDNVMHINQQHMRLRAQSQQLKTDQWPALQIEHLRGIRRDTHLHLPRLRRRRFMREIGQRQRIVANGLQPGTRLPIVAMEGRAQRIVASNDLV